MWQAMKILQGKIYIQVQGPGVSWWYKSTLGAQVRMGTRARMLLERCWQVDGTIGTGVLWRNFRD